jgi:hypothetical protein
MELEKELATFDRERPKLLEQHRGEFVLIHGETIDSFWKTEDEAYFAGCDKFGPEPFLVMPVVEREEPIPLLFIPEHYAGPDPSP